MRAAFCFLAALAAAAAQQPEQVHLALTGRAGELSLDAMVHDDNCSAAWGAQISTTPEFTSADFVPAYACDDFTASEMAPTFAVRVLLTGLAVGQTYYYVVGDESGTMPWSQVFTFTYGSGAMRTGGETFAVRGWPGAAGACVARPAAQVARPAAQVAHSVLRPRGPAGARGLWLLQRGVPREAHGGRGQRPVRRAAARGRRACAAPPRAWGVVRTPTPNPPPRPRRSSRTTLTPTRAWSATGTCGSSSR